MDLIIQADWRDKMIQQSEIYREHKIILVGKTSIQIRRYYIAKMRKILNAAKQKYQRC